MITTERRRDVEHAADSVLAHTSNLTEAAPLILQGICEALDWDYGGFWALADDGSHLTCIESWQRNVRVERFVRVCREAAFTRGIGLPGRVWETGQPTWIDDVVVDPNFPRAAIALECDLHGAFGFPISVKGEFFGVMEFFSTDVQLPDNELLGMLENIGAQIGNFIQSKRLEEELVFQKALLESQGEASLDGILLVSNEQRVLYWNQRLIKMWGVPEEALRDGDAFEVNKYLAVKAADPTVFDEIADAIRADPALTRRDEIELIDGRVLDRWTAPVKTPDGKRLGRTVYYRDISIEKAYERQLTESQQWSVLLSEATAILTESPELDETLDRLTELMVPALGDWCSIQIVDETGLPRHRAAGHVDPSKVDLVREVEQRYATDPRSDAGVYRVIRTRKPLLLSEINEQMLVDAARDEEHLDVIRALGIGSAMVVPIVCRDRALGAFTLGAGESGRRFTKDDLARAMELANRAAFPIDNARLYDEARIVAQTLQKSFLPPALPDIPGVDISARYFPAGQGQQIGGDFYDAFRIDNKRWGLVLGDVSGKGLEAATVTTLARHTIRGAAWTAQHPSEVLQVLNGALLEQQQTDRFCTAVYAIVEPRFARVRVTVASGGHPPPYVIRNDGRVEPVDCGGTLLGFIDGIALRDAQVDLEFGDKLFLYTDGVLDIRQKGGTFGTEGLEKLLYESSKRGTEAATEHIARTLADLQDERSADDIAMILMGVRSSVFNVQSRWSRRESGTVENE